MSKINKVLYNVNQTPDTSEDERRLARKNIGLDEVIGIRTSERETGIAPLGVDAKVPAAYLPSYVDDVIDGYYHDGVFYSDEQYTTAITPECGKIYVDVTAGGNSASYRWDDNGKQYVQMSAQDTYANVAFKGIGASTATTIAATQVSDTIQFTSGAGIDLSRVGNNKEVKIDVAFGNDNHDRSVTLDANGKATATDLTTASPAVPGSGTTTALSFIDTVSQDSRGKITATKKNVNVDSTYSASGTNPVNGTAVSKALETLGVNDISGLSDALAAKQDTLTAGPNVTIDANNTISAPKCTLTEGPNVNIIGITDPSTKTTNYTVSATDTTYSAGSGLDLDGTEFSVDTTVVQPKLTAGTNINIDVNNKISATDTTYSAGTGLQLNSTTFSVDTTAIQPKLTAGTNITIDSSNKISATKSDWNASAGADGEILNKPPITTVQKVYGATANNIKTLKISTSDQSVSGILQDDSSVPLGYVAPLTDDALPGSVLRLDDSKYLEWSFTTAIPEPPQDSSSQYKLLTLDYQGNKLVPKWTTWRQAAEPRELRPVSSGIQIPFTSTGNILSDGDTPSYVKNLSYGTSDYYSISRRQNNSSGATTYYEYYQMHRGGTNPQVNFVTVNSDESVTEKSFDLQLKLTAGSGIAIDSDNTIMCTGSGQVVDGIYKQTTVGNETTTIRFNINHENNPYLDLIKQNNVTSEMLGATYINEESVQSRFINVKAKGKNYIGKFWASQSDTIPGQQTPTASSSIRQLSTALHSVYDGTLSGTGGSQEVPIDRVTLYGNTNHSYDDNNLGNLTVGTLAMRIINASNTSPSHQLLASCAKGEIDLINVNKAEELYTLTSDSASSYIGVAANDCMLMVTTNPRQCTDAVARTKQAGDSDLGSIVMFPSKAYIDGQIENLNDIYLKQSFVSTAHVRLKTDTTFLNGNNTSIMSTTLTVAGNGTGTYDLQPIARKADRNGLISITITSLSPGKKCIMSVIGRASGESGYNTLLRFGGESDTALELYSYSATIPVIYDWSINGGSFKISINNTASSEVKYLIQVTAISGPCDYYP